MIENIYFVIIMDVTSYLNQSNIIINIENIILNHLDVQYVINDSHSIAIYKFIKESMMIQSQRNVNFVGIHLEINQH